MYNKTVWISALAGVLILGGCTLFREPAPPSRYGDDIKGHPPVVRKDTQVDSRAQASAALLQQAVELLGRQRADDAIDLLERSIALDPKDGRVYYYLAEGWRLKKNIDQARQFNRLASIYLDYDPAWKTRVAEQEAAIQNIR